MRSCASSGAMRRAVHGREGRPVLYIAAPRGVLAGLAGLKCFTEPALAPPGRPFDGRGIPQEADAAELRGERAEHSVAEMWRDFREVGGDFRASLPRSAGIAHRCHGAFRFRLASARSREAGSSRALRLLGVVSSGAVSRKDDRNDQKKVLDKMIAGLSARRPEKGG